MTARVRRLSYDGHTWLIAVTRDHELTVPGHDRPALSDLPDDVATALREWLGEAT